MAMYIAQRMVDDS
jgi:hypothetical protein